MGDLKNVKEIYSPSKGQIKKSKIRNESKSKTPFNVIWQPDNVVAGKNLPYVSQLLNIT